LDKKIYFQQDFYMETSNKYRINLNTLIYDLKTERKKPVKNYENNLKLRNFSSPNLLFQQDEGQKSLLLIEWNLLTSSLSILIVEIITTENSLCLLLFSDDFFLLSLK
jgi:hypothetical protein